MAIIGIDLGTTNSLISYWNEEKSESIIIPNRLEKNLTPSVIAIDQEGEILVGEVAKEWGVSHPECCVSVFKRAMGTKKKYRLGAREFLPEELSAIVLKSLKEDAEYFLKKPVDEAIISVPAYFNDTQRKATKRAGELIGLKVERLISEPTAAAIAYGLHQQDANMQFLVFDLGGGTFDVSILEMFNHVMEVRAVAGNNYLGGEDFTMAIIEEFLKDNHLAEEHLSQKEYALLRKRAEIAKRELNDSNEVTIDCWINNEMISSKITRERYDFVIRDLLNKLKEPILRALRDADIDLNDIHAVLLVGGATKLYCIKSFVGKLFGKLPFVNINPDEVVAIGAGIQAALKGKDAVLKEVILTDVCPYTLGVDSCKMIDSHIYRPGYFCPIIERNTVIPVSRISTFTTVHDRQKEILFKVYQGEELMVKDNLFLGELSVHVPPAPAEHEIVNIRFTYNLNGLLEVEATVLSTGQVKQLIIEKNPGDMTKEEIQESIKSLAYLKIHPRDNYENKLLLAKGQRLYAEHLGVVREYIGCLLADFEGALESQDKDKIRESRKVLISKLNALDNKGEF